MFNLNPLGKIVIPFYLFIYLIFPYSAITETTKSNFRKNLENALNTRDLEFIKASFKDTDNLKILNKFSKIRKIIKSLAWFYFHKFRNLNYFFKCGRFFCSSSNCTSSTCTFDTFNDIFNSKSTNICCSCITSTC